MTLRAFLDSIGGRQLSRFARQIGVSPSTVYRYVNEGVIPGRVIMKRISAATKGAVTPVDFYGIKSKAG